MSECSERAAIVEEAMSWRGTPYRPNQDIKDKNGGVDCGMLLVRVFVDVGEKLKKLNWNTVGKFPDRFDPRPYPNQWHLHNRAERYKGIVESLAHELSEGIEPGPGDIILFHFGHCYAHGGIVTKWPIIIHARGPRPVLREDVSVNTTLRNLRKKFFTIWYKE